MKAEIYTLIGKTVIALRQAGVSPKEIDRFIRQVDEANDDLEVVKKIVEAEQWEINQANRRSENKQAQQANRTNQISNTAAKQERAKEEYWSSQGGKMARRQIAQKKMWGN